MGLSDGDKLFVWVYAPAPFHCPVVLKPISVGTLRHFAILSISRQLEAFIYKRIMLSTRGIVDNAAKGLSPYTPTLSRSTDSWGLKQVQFLQDLLHKIHTSLRVKNRLKKEQRRIRSSIYFTTCCLPSLR